MKKPITQVMEWLQDEVDGKTDDDLVATTARKCRWASRLLKRVDARDSQNQVKRKKAKKKAGR